MPWWKVSCNFVVFEERVVNDLEHVDDVGLLGGEWGVLWGKWHEWQRDA